jgi:hypothetical protein
MKALQYSNTNVPTRCIFPKLQELSKLCLISKYCKMDIQLPSEVTPVGGSTSVALNVDAPWGAVVIVCMCRNSFTVNLEVGRSTMAGLKWYLREFLMVWEHDSRESFARNYPRDFMVVDASANLLADDNDISCHRSVTVFELFGTTPCDLYHPIVKQVSRDKTLPFPRNCRPG